MIQVVVLVEGNMHTPSNNRFGGKQAFLNAV